MRHFPFISTNVLIALFLLAGCISGNKPAEKDERKSDHSIEVEINRNIETVGIILNLSALGDYIVENFSKEEKRYEWLLAVRKRFENYREHPAVLQVNEMAESNLISFGHYYYGITFSPLPEFKPTQPALMNLFGEPDLPEEALNAILISYNQKIRDFYIDAALESFFRENEKLYQKILEEVETTIPDDQLQLIESFFGEKNGKYVLCASPMIPMNFNFGPDIVKNDTTTFYYITGPSYDLQQPGQQFEDYANADSLGFNDREYIAELAVHEFGHSFVSFLSKPANRAEIEKLEYLNTETLKENMENIGESSEWSTTFEEHLVRASEIMITLQSNQVEKAREKQRHEREEEGVLYIDQFVASLEKYQHQRDSFPNLESYFDLLINDLLLIPAP